MPKSSTKAAVAVVLASMAAIGLWFWWRPPVRAVEAPKYGGHRLLVWAIDGKTGDVAGFADRTIRPGEAAELEPVAGYQIRFELGRPEATETLEADGRRGSEVLVGLKTSHGHTTSDGSKSVGSPFLDLGSGDGGPIRAVVIGIPEGSRDPLSLRGVPGRGDLATPSALEDLLLAALDDPSAGDWFGLPNVIQVYRLLGRTRREDRWRARLATGTPAGRIEAALILGSIGDEAGASAFRRACLAARGNERVRLIDLLGALPPSAETLRTTVELIVGPDQYLTRIPGVGVADIERRFGLIQGLANRYPKADVRPYADRLRAHAASLPAGDATRANVMALLDQL